MSGQVAADGHVIPPLNITAPAPSLNLRGFNWQTVDSKILGPQPHAQHHEELSARAAALPVQAPLAQAAAVAVPAPAAPPTPAAPPAAAAPIPATQGAPTPSAPQPPAPGAVAATPVPPQLASQLVHGVFRGARPAPPFPLTQFQGSYAGNGFNLIWRPRAQSDDTPFTIKNLEKTPPDNILQLNLTTEQLTFGETIGGIPNRGLVNNQQKTITLQGFPYLQTVQDVTNPDSGLGDNLFPTDIHFEPGMFLWVPACETSPKFGESIVRMASIPHGTTINAQGLSPAKSSSPSVLGGVIGPPNFDAVENIIDTTPFDIDNFASKQTLFRSTMKANETPLPVTGPAPPRIPQDLSAFNTPNNKTITTKIIQNPNLVLKNAIKELTITENISFTVATGPSPVPPRSAQPLPKGAGTANIQGAGLNGGGTANISFLAGTQDPLTNATPDNPNAHAAFMTTKYWIELVAYPVKIPVVNTGPSGGTLQLRPTMPAGSTAPTPVFAVTLPPNLSNKTEKTVTIPGIQIQSSQIVNLNFATLTWPHASVSTLVPVDPQPFTVQAKDLA
jgi:hypothetical protein